MNTSTANSANSTERKIGFFGLAGAISGYFVLISIDNGTKSVCANIDFKLWPLLLLSVASLGAIVWAATRVRWFWAFAALAPLWLLFSVLGTFEGC
jgi:hypothetical protein